MTNENKSLCFDDALAQVKKKINLSLRLAPFLVREYTSHLSQAQGKLIRARAVLLCSMNENKEISCSAVNIAASIELLHLASLVHDDVMDDANFRRNIKTLNNKYGRKTAVICGDFLFSLSLEMASSISKIDHEFDPDMPKIIKNVCLGELRQHINNGNLDITKLAYYKIINGKTASLFSGAFYAGSLFSNEKNYKKYKRLGHYLGMIFQINDDLIDFKASEKQAKKPVSSDFSQGVITLPLIFALENDYLLKTKINKMTSDEISVIVKDIGGIAYAENVINSYYSKAIKLINSINMPDFKKIELTKLFENAKYGVMK